MTASYGQIMTRALAAHRAGKLSEAAHLYRSGIELYTCDAEALHLLGVLHDAQGESEQATTLI
jgi:hypothetical protein